MTPLEQALASGVYWYELWLKENIQLIDSEDRLAKSNELSLHRYEVGEKFIKENDKLKIEIAELKEWLDECTSCNIQAYYDGFKQGHKEGKDSEQDKQSYASGYEAGRKDGDAICVNRIADIKDLYGILGEI